MAEVSEQYTWCSTSVHTTERGIIISGADPGENFIRITPLNKEDAKNFAFMLRKAAKKLESMYERLPDKVHIKSRRMGDNL